MSPVVQMIIASAIAVASDPAPVKTEITAPSMRMSDKSDESKLKSLTAKYRSAKVVTMKVSKTLKLGLLGEERKSQGTMIISNGRLRLELEGAEKTLLVVNRKRLWAVTFPPPEFKDAAVQVIKADTGSTKAKSQALTGLLGAGDFSKSFKTTAVQRTEDKDLRYFLTPVKEQADFKRAQVLLSGDGKTIKSLGYWDERDNETVFQFSETTFGNKVDAKSFDYVPPTNADVMNL
jgi:outer membrane lipoprotein-sorting protein